jgi:3-deoxy-D-manno-octulosonate 8-phosphate phosphatase (KDO 8-P phosphatase)
VTQIDSNKISEDVLARARRIKLLLMDCDGVLTDGRIWLNEDYDEQKGFHVRDGQGISLMHCAGLRTGIISGRKSTAVERRAHDLKITYVHQFAKDKIKALEEIIRAAGVSPEECVFVGDDLADIRVMRHVGLAVAVADAVEETRQAAHYVTKIRGGHGAVREICELILKSQGLWDDLMKSFNP